MKRGVRRVVVALPMVLAVVAASGAAQPAREVAVTVDDLPFVTGRPLSAAEVRVQTAKLLAAIRAHGVTAIGFVNEGKLYRDGERDEARVGLLRQWLDAGFELGNHSYSHPDLHHLGLARFEEDVVKGEEVTRALLSERGQTLRYFRHPMLHTGRDLGTKRGLEAATPRYVLDLAGVSEE